MPTSTPILYGPFAVLTRNPRRSSSCCCSFFIILLAYIYGAYYIITNYINKDLIENTIGK